MRRATERAALSSSRRDRPHTIEAFFRTDDHGRGRKNDRVAHLEHARFLQEYHLRAEDVPLLEFDHTNWKEPFREVRS